jgi:hypothetical protein
MHTFHRAPAIGFAFAACLLFGLLRSATACRGGAEAQVPVVIGSVECFVVRCPDGELSAADRVDHIQDVFAKHLGSPTGEFAVRKSPEKGSTKLQILLNGDQVVNVTSNDARATRYRKPEEVAQLWMKALQHAFDETHVRPDPEHP